MDRFHQLKAEEAHILLEKGTEPPFSGEYEELRDGGVYLCRQCDFPLFLSSSKFSSGCGWPSFDEEISGHLIRRPDEEREEILCARCHGHLGHRFIGEQFTPKNVRHCVNSRSLRFLPSEENGSEIAYFAGGCFWSIQYYLEKAKGVESSLVGYMNGWGVWPTYKEVCTNRYDFAEAVKLYYDPEKTTYGELVDLFFDIHNPSEVDRQGPDVGRQYRSAIFYLTKEQEKVAEERKKSRPHAVTEIAVASQFYPAEEEHQHYLAKRGQEPFCHL